MSAAEPATYDELHAEIKRLRRQVDDLVAERRQQHDAIEHVRFAAAHPRRDDPDSASADVNP